MATIDFDGVAWGESGAANGLTARTGVTDTRYRTSGDNHILRAMGKQPYLCAMWMGSVTAAKSEGFEIVSAAKTIDDFCAGGSVRDGCDPFRMASQLVSEDTITGYLDNANTAEITVGVAAISYGDPVIYSPVPVLGGGSVIRLDSTTDTAGSLPAGWVTAAVTWSGLQPQKEYSIVGIGGWGTLDVALRLASTSEYHAQYKPVVPLGTTPAFSRMTYFATPYKFKGSSPPAIEIQSLGASAEHHLSFHIV